MCRLCLCVKLYIYTKKDGMLINHISSNNVKGVENNTELGEGICDNILFLHAILGCDTTSRLYEIGKGTVPNR